jgi:Flp pilus assembly protein TadG
MAVGSSLAACLTRLTVDRSAASVAIMALTMPVGVLAALGSLNVSLTYADEIQLQSVADAAAIGAAKELTLGRPTKGEIVAIVESYVRAKLPANDTRRVVAKLVDRDTGVSVEITQTVKGTISVPGLAKIWDSRAISVAHVTSGPPICLIALEPVAPKAIVLEENARMDASNCAVYSNSTHKNGLISVDEAALTASMICTAGGKLGNRANFNPDPITDCPVLPDPLAERPAPSVDGCTEVNKIVRKGAVTLRPGVYCGGLKVAGSAVATLLPGNYIIKDGPLSVTDSGTLEGVNTSFYLTGNDAQLNFTKGSTINLTAAKTGPLAGFLFFEDRLAPLLREHRIASDNAQTLLGTIYLPRGRLVVDSSKPVAARSAFTIIVTQRMKLFAGPNLILNTNYDGTDVPVVPGIGNLGGRVMLTN